MFIYRVLPILLLLEKFLLGKVFAVRSDQLCLLAKFILVIEYWLKVIFCFALTVYGLVDEIALVSFIVLVIRYIIMVLLDMVFSVLMIMSIFVLLTSQYSCHLITQVIVYTCYKVILE